MEKHTIDKKIGIIGGGQLGKMMTLSGKAMGFNISFLDPADDCPSHSVSDNHITAPFSDTAAIKRLADMTDVLTYEFEHINADFLFELEQKGYVIYPTAKSLLVIKDKLRQKERLTENGIKSPDYVAIDHYDDIVSAFDRWGKLVLKTRTGGYDGKGNAFILTADDIKGAYESLGSGNIPLMAERYISYDKEISVLACRGIDGQVAVYPVAENHHKDNILEKTVVPAHMSDMAAKAAMDVARRVMDAFQGVGMFCVEMFVTPDGLVLVNEVAPRPHNSGHYTIEACVTSQFENHIRAITGLPLGQTALLRPVCMRNILGSGNPGATVVSGADDVLALNGAKLHVYGKAESRPKRKMGHITVTAETVEKAAEIADKAFERVTISGRPETKGV